MTGEEKQSGGGLSFQTLLISSVSAVIATVVVSQFWEAGTLFFTAMVPIAVAVVSEVLRRPAEKMTQVAPLVVAPRRAAGTTPIREPAVPEEARRKAPETEDPFGLREPERRSWLGDRRVRIGLVTGLIAFVVGAAFITVLELTNGNSFSGSERRTTLLGGRASGTADQTKTTTGEEDRRATPEATATPAPGTTPTPTATPSATPKGSPTPTVTPSPSASPRAATPPPDASGGGAVAP